jgi:hypothetical protein
MRLLLDFPRYLRRICQGYTFSEPHSSMEREVAEAFCLQGIPPACQGVLEQT